MSFSLLYFVLSPSVNEIMMYIILVWVNQKNVTLKQRTMLVGFERGFNENVKRDCSNKYRFEVTSEARCRFALFAQSEKFDVESTRSKQGTYFQKCDEVV